MKKYDCKRIAVLIIILTIAVFAYMKAVDILSIEDVGSVSNTNIPTEDVKGNAKSTLNSIVSLDNTTPQICMCYGDSLTWYDGHAFKWGENQGETCVGFETYLQKNLGFITINEGISGQTTPQICERVSCDSATIYADIITIMGGDNDDRLSISVGTLLPAGSMFDTTTVYGSLQNAIETLLDKNPTVKIILMTEPMGWTYRDNKMMCVDDVYPEAYRRVAALYGLPLIDNWKYSGINEATRNIYYVDPSDETNTLYMYHPNNIGWECISMYICQEIVRYVE